MSEAVKKKLENSWAPIFYEHVFCKIDEKPFAVLYSDTGRPNFPVNIALSLEYIKHLMNYTDDDLIENYYFNYLINYAVGLKTLGELNLAERTLYDFRNRVYRYTREHPGEDDLIFGQFTALLDEFAQTAGVSMKQQRMDSTLFMSNIKKSGRLSLAYDVLTKTVKAIPEDLRSPSLQEVLTSEFRTNTLYRIKVNETESKLDALLNLCREARDVLSPIHSDAATEALRIVSRFLNEQAKPHETTNRLTARDNEEISSQSLQSAHDEDATYRNKAGKAQSGYVANISETCSKENAFNLITDYKVAPNTTSDVELLKERLPRIHNHTDCDELYVDGGYYSEEIATTKAQENRTTIHFTDMTGKDPVNKIPATEFEFEEDSTLIKRCPKGIVPLRTAVKNGQTVAHFPVECCTTCELLERCPGKSQKNSYVVRMSHKSLTAARQRLLIAKNHKMNCSMRAGIEGSNSALKRRHRMGRLDVRGLAKSQVVVGLKITAQNFRRFCKHMLEQMKSQRKQVLGVSLS